MLKVCTSYSKKVPADEQFSSKQFHASVEIELSDALTGEQLRERIHQTFALVRETVEAEIHGIPAASRSRPAPDPKSNGKASNAQIKYLTSLASDQNIRLSALNQYCEQHYHVNSIYDLTKKDASALVDALKRRAVRISG